MARTLLLTVALLLSAAWPAASQNLKVDFHDGKVSVEATSVPVRAILAEWGKIGGTKILGAERINGAPITIKLINVTEAQALETILRSVAGYMAAPRNAGAAGPSRYDRILVMATTSAPAPAAANTRPGPQPSNAFNGTQRFIPPSRQRPEQDEAVEMEEPDENPPNPPVFTFPQPGVNQPGQFQGAPGNIVNPNPNFQMPAPAPAQPQAPVGVSQPGMMVQPPAPPPGTAQPGMIRPPGRGGNQ